MKKVLWASRHALDPSAEEALREVIAEEFGDDPEVQISHREILWPTEWRQCRSVASELVEEFHLIAGVWPAQAVEAFRGLTDQEQEYTLVISPVSVPETEPDVKKTRPFRFVRWAYVA